jgi:hypothetical protein
LTALGAVLANHETLNVNQVAWHVDPDNPAWPDVRAAAIQAGIRKGRNYAAALGGSLDHVEHIADAGLLGGGVSERYRLVGDAAPMRSLSGGGGPDAPSLDPVPQQLTATIEARSFMATGVSLTEH